jgi:2-isopropylmalate synthase
MDIVLDSLNEKRFVLWEEIARDGAQAKTILSGNQRVEIAKLQSKIYKGNAHKHLVFAAGFISVGKGEVEAIKKVVEQVDECNIAVNCRANNNEIDLSVQTVKNAKYPRLAVVFPASERLANVMLHKKLSEIIPLAVDKAKYALDKAGNIPVDFQLAASFDAKPEFIAEISSKLIETGIQICHLGDTRGRIYPNETKKYFKKLLLNSNSKRYGVHFHNDLGFALMNNIEALKAGINLVSSSWLGLAERNGLMRTELISLLLSYKNKKLKKRLGVDASQFFEFQNDLKYLKIVADKVSEFTGLSLKVTDPIVGTGVNSISTGTPFVDPKSFQPFDPEKVLGIKQRIHITQLASKRVITAVAEQMGISLSDIETENILEIVKEKTFLENIPIINEDEFLKIIKTLRND